MDTQNIPVHVRLWNKHFWLLAMANLLLVMSSYMLIATIPLCMEVRGYSMLQMALVMGVFFIGIYLFGSLSGYLVQRYRRKMYLMSQHYYYWQLQGTLLSKYFTL